MPPNSSDMSPDHSVLRLLIKGAAHHQDLRFMAPEDTPELSKARQMEFEYISRWLGVKNAGHLFESTNYDN